MRELLREIDDIKQRQFPSRIEKVTKDIRRQTATECLEIFNNCCNEARYKVSALYLIKDLPDTSKCDNSECPSYTMCWRFMAKPSDHQYYGKFEPPTGAKKCWYFEPIGDRS
jgi:hypothetical protein